ncbi:MAG: hypothetical protein ABI459_11740, partial [Deltaproteobacteria bacterium]
RRPRTLPGALETGDAPVHLLVQFRDAVILRLLGHPERIKAITNIGGLVGFSGLKVGQLAFNEDVATKCQVEVFDGPVKDDEKQIKVLNGVFDQKPSAIVVSYTIGHADLAKGENRVGMPMSGILKPGYTDAAGDVWRKMELFNPGGFIEMSPADVVSTAKVTKPDLWPEAAGLAKLLATGVLSALDTSGTAIEVREIEPGKVRMGSKTFVPGLGDDLIRYDGLDFLEEKPGIWIGRPRAEYRVNQSFTFPVGLTTTTAATFFVPPDVPVPDGDAGGNEVKRSAN